MYNFLNFKWAIVLFHVFLFSNAFCQYKEFTGSHNNARFKIIIPEKWNHNLVMYAHGYEFMNSPSGIDNPGFQASMKVFLDRGYAIAASAYQFQGFALPEGIEDTESLRKYFNDTYGVPDTTYMVGHSMGGGVSIGVIEKYGENYAGALPLCALSSRPYLQTRKEFDLFAVFNVLFPGIVSPLSEILDPNTRPMTGSMADIFAKAASIKQELLKDSLKASRFAQRFDLKLDDLPFTLLFGENVLRDLVKKSGGNPFDNRNTVYNGFQDDWKINTEVERLSALPEAYQFMDRYNPTGVINIPVLMMHTVYDQLIPPSLGVVNYDNMVQQKGRSAFLVVTYTNGQGHCQFTPWQTSQAFDMLRGWVASGQKPQEHKIE